MSTTRQLATVWTVSASSASSIPNCRRPLLGRSRRSGVTKSTPTCEIKGNTLQRIRKSMSIYKRVSIVNKAEADAEAERLVRQELDSGVMDGFGRGHLSRCLGRCLGTVPPDRPLCKSLLVNSHFTAHPGCEQASNATANSTLNSFRFKSYDVLLLHSTEDDIGSSG